MILRWVISVDRDPVTRLGITQTSVAHAVLTLLTAKDVGYLQGANAKYPVALRQELSVDEWQATRSAPGQAT